MPNLRLNTICCLPFFKVLSFLILFLILSLSPAGGYCQTTGDSITLAASKKYEKNAFHRFWWGEHYRAVWSEPVTAPFFWLSDLKGGVTPLKQGGSFQTKNLRLVDKDKREYVLRSIDKNPTVALPESLRNTFIGKLMQDQTSVIHPYGAFIVPTLASAAGVYHTNPRLVYLADDPALGEYREEFGNMLMLLEERPDGNWEELASFGKPEKVVSSKKAFENLLDNPRYRVNSRQYLTSRLFDMWLSDWSRREDQWRWAEEKKKEGIAYGPIPRDRDHAFFKFDDGVLTFLVAIFKPNYQTFDKTITAKNVKGLIKSSKRMDAYFLAYMPKEVFMEVALELQQKMSDAVIEKALAQWPPQIRELSGKKFTKILQARRQDLPTAAAAFYSLLNEDVLLPGTDEKDRFKLEFKPDGSLLVQHWGEEKNQKEKLLQEKLFHSKETRSLSLYGLGEEDVLEVAGEGENNFEVKWYGGEDTDQITYPKELKLTGKKILVLQEEDGNDYPKRKLLKVKDHDPQAEEFTGKGWLLRHRLH